MESMSDVRVLDNLQQVAEAAAEKFISHATRAIEQHGRFTVALSGGSTPKALHAKLVERTAQNAKLLDWSRVDFFFGDERHVPPDHPDSNFRMANETLLSKVPARVHPMFDCDADAYERDMRGVFGDVAWPSLDLDLLGI